MGKERVRLESTIQSILCIFISRDGVLAGDSWSKFIDFDQTIGHTTADGASLAVTMYTPYLYSCLVRVFTISCVPP